jgi:hypothetical protein
MTLDFIIYDVREVLKQYTSDSEIDDRYIIHLFNIKRAKYLRQELNNYQRTTDISATQTICMETELVSNNECGIDYDCGMILRTKEPVPTPLELHTKSAVTSVKPTTRLTVPFNFVTKQKAAYAQHSPYNSGIYAFLDNDMRVYLVSESPELNLIECISVTAVFEDPLQTSTFNTCCGCDEPKTCYDISTTNYPLQPHYIDLIKAEIVKELAIGLSMPEDRENDSTDDQEQKNRGAN